LLFFVVVAVVVVFFPRSIGFLGHIIQRECCCFFSLSRFKSRVFHINRLS
jgi:hypothetical protein